MSDVVPDDPAWWREAVIYQIYPRSFADANGDGVGDLQGIIGKIDHFERLGVDALWLSPIYRSPMADFGYDVADYCLVDPLFGTNDDVVELADRLHERGMRLLLDWVPNHTSDQHEWFVEARSSRDNPKRDWYVWRDRKPNGDPPNAWMSAFKGVPAWTHDHATDQSYLHLFLAEQPDLNWSNPDVEAAMHDTLRYWLDRGVDGFRADVVHLIGKGDSVDDPADEGAAWPVGAIDRPLGHELLRRIRDLLDGYEHEPMMVGEVYLLEAGQSVRYLGNDAPGERELHLSFDFRPLHAEWDAARMAATINTAQAEFDEWRWPTWVLSNHDHARHRSRFGSEARARAAAVLSLTVRGTPFLFAGEEFGLEDAVVAGDRIVDPGGRDGCRAPIPWAADGDDASGHGWPTAPWLPFPANASTNAADQQIGVDGSMFELYRSLLAARRASPALRGGTMSEVVRQDDVLRFERTAPDGSEHLDVVVNLGSEPVELDDPLEGELVMSTHADRTTVDRSVAADEALVVRRSA